MNASSTKESKKPRRKRRPKTDYKAPKVFVLPPNLLEKLGINLGTISSSKQSKSEVLNNDAVTNPVEEIVFNSSDNIITKNRDNDSILETADLMRKSVFLSPTFIPIDSNTISGEVEISNLDSNLNEKTCTLQAFYDSVNMQENSVTAEAGMLQNQLDNAEKNTDQSSILNNNEFAIQTNTMIVTNDVNSTNIYSVKDKIMETTIIFPLENEIDTNLNLISKEIQLEDSTTKTYSPYCSDNIKDNIASSKEIIQKNFELIDTKNKVNIIAEEIVDSAKLKKIFEPSQPNNLKPVSVNTLITMTSTYDSSELEIQDNTSRFSFKNFNSDFHNPNILPMTNIDCDDDIISLSLSTDYSNENMIQTGHSNIPEHYLVEDTVKSCINNSEYTQGADEFYENIGEIKPKNQPFNFDPEKNIANDILNNINVNKECISFNDNVFLNNSETKYNKMNEENCAHDNDENNKLCPEIKVQDNVVASYSNSDVIFFNKSSDSSIILNNIYKDDSKSPQLNSDSENLMDNLCHNNINKNCNSSDSIMFLSLEIEENNQANKNICTVYGDTGNNKLSSEVKLQKNVVASYNIADIGDINESSIILSNISKDVSKDQQLNSDNEKQMGNRCDNNIKNENDNSSSNIILLGLEIEKNCEINENNIKISEDNRKNKLSPGCKVQETIDGSNSNVDVSDFSEVSNSSITLRGIGNNIFIDKELNCDNEKIIGDHFHKNINEIDKTFNSSNDDKLPNITEVGDNFKANEKNCLTTEHIRHIKPSLGVDVLDNVEVLNGCDKGMQRPHDINENSNSSFVLNIGKDISKDQQFDPDSDKLIDNHFHNNINEINKDFKVSKDTLFTNHSEIKKNYMKNEKDWFFIEDEGNNSKSSLKDKMQGDFNEYNSNGKNTQSANEFNGKKNTSVIVPNLGKEMSKYHQFCAHSNINTVCDLGNKILCDSIIDENCVANDKIWIANEDKGNNNKISQEIKVDVDSSENLGTLSEINSKLGQRKDQTIKNSKSMESSQNVLLDKVSEIASYLIDYFGSNKKKNKKTNKNFKGSKVCIQGVEKPGGSQQKIKTPMQRKKIIRTYERQPKPKQFLLNTDLNNLDAFKLHDNVEKEITLEKHAIPLKSQEFCICSDFGRLGFYSCDSLYMHIHYWKPRNVKCNTDVILSIYNENTVYNDRSNVFEIFEKEITNDNNIIDLNICWNEIEDEEVFPLNNKILDQKSSSSQTKYVNQTQTDDACNNIAITVNSVKSDENNEVVVIKIIESDDSINEDISLENEDNTTKTMVIPDKSGLLKSRNKMESLEAIVDSNKRDLGEDLLYSTKKGTIQNEMSSLKNENANETSSASKNYMRKRRMSSISAEKLHNKKNTEKSKKKSIKCGVCHSILQEGDWEDHISSKHCYFAWPDGVNIEIETLIKDDNILKKLKKRINEEGVLVCTFCTLKLKSVKKLIKHIRKCYNSKNGIETGFVKCGVCSQDLHISLWMEHIEKAHGYLAWKEGETPLNLNDDESVWQYLNITSKEIGGLICSKCGLNRKYVKHYLAHYKKCEGNKVVEESPVPEKNLRTRLSTNNLSNTISRKRKLSDASTSALDTTCNSSLQDTDSSNINTLKDFNSDISNIEYKPDITLNASQTTLKCGVCGKEVKSEDWMSHIQKEHYYLAWEHGKPTLNVDDEKEVKVHLLKLVAKMGHLTCPHCGITKKKPKVYLKHIAAHSNNEDKPDDSVTSTDILSEDNMCQCAICLVKLNPKHWTKHAVNNHYNMAWKVGESPIDLNDPNLAIRLVKQYKDMHGKLVCKLCGDSKASILGFYAHVLVCGKTEEEMEPFKAFCDVCKKKYMRVYEYQHMRAHRDKQLADEKKLLDAQKKREVKETIKNIAADFKSKKNRRAAEKAKSVIEKYNAQLSDGNTICEKCKLDGTKCNCIKIEAADCSDSETSVKLEILTSESSNPTDLESEGDISDDDRGEKRKKKHMESCQLKTNRIPFGVTDEKSYFEQSYKDYCHLHLTDETLFRDWFDIEYEIVPEDELQSYMPPLEESCQVQMGKSNWIKFARFESKKVEGLGIFVGGSVQCMRWAPARLRNSDIGQEHGSGDGHYLAMSVHLCHDQPRYDVETLYAHTALLQIWDVGDFDEILPKIALGLAHDSGTIWSMDWCPSGAREPLPESKEDMFERPLRLGLLAAACSNGKVYIYSIPYPSTIVRTDNVFYKIKPVAELRLTIGQDRQLYQATSVCWSTQNNHSLVIVGYADGTVAFYDLSSTSPLLKSTEGKKVIFNPYHDERIHNCSITGVRTFPARDGGAQRGAWCASSLSSCELRVGPRSSYASLVTNDVIFSPHWPSALLSGDDALVALVVNELELWGQGRRTGGVRALSACPRCAHVACFTPPHVRVIITHPIKKEMHKCALAEVIMTPIGEKRKEKPVKDELTVKLEPNTYHEVITEYGVTFRIMDRNKKKSQRNGIAPIKEIHPDRFPLADVPCLAFCPAEAFHDWLAVATHSGVIFFMKA